MQDIWYGDQHLRIMAGGSNLLAAVADRARPPAKRLLRLIYIIIARLEVGIHLSGLEIAVAEAFADPVERHTSTWRVDNPINSDYSVYKATCRGRVQVQPRNLGSEFRAGPLTAATDLESATR